MGCFEAEWGEERVHEAVHGEACPGGGLWGSEPPFPREEQMKSLLVAGQKMGHLVAKFGRERCLQGGR